MCPYWNIDGLNYCLEVPGLLHQYSFVQRSRFKLHRSKKSTRSTSKRSNYARHAFPQMRVLQSGAWSIPWACMPRWLVVLRRLLGHVAAVVGRLGPDACHLDPGEMNVPSSQCHSIAAMGIAASLLGSGAVALRTAENDRC